MNFECGLYKDEYCARFKVLQQLLDPPNRHKNYLDLPVRLFKKQILKPSAYYALKFPATRCRYMINYESVPAITVLHSHEKQQEETIACIVNIDRKYDEPLILECSSGSLDFVLKEEMDAKSDNSIVQASSRDKSNEAKSPDEPSETNINVFSVIDEPYNHDNVEFENNDSLTLISTSSSSSSTREFYLPASTGSNDTIKIADAIRETTQFPKLPFKAPKIYKQPTLSNNTEFSGCGFNMPPILVNKDYLDAPKYTKRNSMNLTKFQNINKDKINNQQLSVIIRREDIPVPFIKIDKLYNEVLKHLKVNEDSSHCPRIYKKSLNLKTIDKKKIKIKSRRVLEEPINKNSLPGPEDWIKEIKNNKLILEQDIIENCSLKNSATASCVSLLSNEHQNLNKVNVPIHQNKQTNSTKNENNTVIDKSNDFDKNITIKCSNNEVKNSNELFESPQTGVKLSDSSFLSFKNSSENYNIDLNNINIKFKKLNGLTEMSTKKPGLTKLLVSSDLIVEGSGSGPEEDEINYVKRRKKRNFKIPPIGEEEPKLSKYSRKEYIKVTSGQLSDSISRLKYPTHKQLKKEQPEKATTNNNMKYSSQDDGVYIESLFSEKFNFNKLREKFDLKTSYDKCKTYASRILQDWVGDSKEIVSNVTGNKSIQKSVAAQEPVAINETVHTNEKSADSLETRRKEIIDIKKYLKCNSENNLLTKKDKLEYSKCVNEDHPKMKEGRLVSKNGQPAHLYDKAGLPYTDFKGRLLKNNLGIPVLNIKSYKDVVKNNLSVYDTTNVKVGEPDFDPSKKPDVSSVVKVTDKVGNPASLYNNIGWPLTDEDGILLYNSNGEILVSLDSRFFPLCCKNGTPIYLRNGSTWLSQRYKYIVTTQNKVTDLNKPKNETPSLLSDKEMNMQLKHFYTNQNSRINEPIKINDNVKKNAISTQYNSSDQSNNSHYHGSENNSTLPTCMYSRKPQKKSNLTSSNFALGKIYDEIAHQNGSLEDGNDTTDFIYDTIVPIFDLEGNRLNDDNGYPLVNMYGEPLLLFDKNGRAISDAYGGPIFSSMGEQLLSSSIYTGNTLFDTYPNEETYLPPERPYCEQLDKTNHPYLNSVTQQSSDIWPEQFENPLHLYKDSEPLLKIIEQNDIRAWDIHNEVPSSVQSIYSLIDYNYKSTPSFHPAKGDLLVNNHGQQYYTHENKYSKPTYSKYSYPRQAHFSNNPQQLHAQQYYTNYAQPVVSYNNTNYYDMENGSENNYATDRTNYLSGHTRNIRVISIPPSSYKAHRNIEHNQYY